MSKLLPDQVAFLEARVKNRLGARVKNLRLALHDHGLIIRGLAWSYYAKQLAQQAIMENSNVPIAANEIEVCGHIGNAPAAAST